MNKSLSYTPGTGEITYTDPFAKISFSLDVDEVIERLNTKNEYLYVDLSKVSAVNSDTGEPIDSTDLVAIPVEDLMFLLMCGCKA